MCVRKGVESDTVSERDVVSPKMIGLSLFQSLINLVITPLCVYVCVCTCACISVCVCITSCVIVMLEREEKTPRRVALTSHTHTHTYTCTHMHTFSLSGCFFSSLIPHFFLWSSFGLFVFKGPHNQTHTP